MNLCAVIWSRETTLDELGFCVSAWIDFFQGRGLKLFIAVDDSYDTTITKKNWSVNFIKFQRAGWKKEWLEVSDKLERFGYTHFFSILDDFYLKWSDSCAFEKILNLKGLSRIQYLNMNFHPDQTLEAHPEGEFEHVIFDIVPNRCDYRSSLQVSLWNVDYFREILDKSNSIWDFENISSPDIVHYCVKNPVFKYRHIIEKGKWNYNIFGLPGKILFGILLNSNIRYNYAQLKVLHRIIISNLLISLVGLRAWKRIKSSFSR